MRTIAIMNNKGGVGKTVTAINLADILVRYYRQRVVLADCDGQMNLSKFFFPELDQGDAPLQGGFQLLDQGLPAGPLPVGDGVELQQLGVKGHGRLPPSTGEDRPRDRGRS